MHGAENSVALSCANLCRIGEPGGSARQLHYQFGGKLSYKPEKKSRDLTQYYGELDPIMKLWQAHWGVNRGR